MNNNLFAKKLKISQMAKLSTKINTKQNKKLEITVNLLICRYSFTYCFRKKPQGGEKAIITVHQPHVRPLQVFYTTAFRIADNTSQAHSTPFTIGRATDWDCQLYQTSPLSPLYCPPLIRKAGHAPNRFDYSMALEQSFGGHGMIVPRPWNNHRTRTCRHLRPSQNA